MCMCNMQSMCMQSAECDAAHDAAQDTVSNAALRLQTEG